ncbi:MAG TPA: ABC transporter permease, partial [Gammaproteobacteria bacterium]|nr:ABC transporter permease [Gammaproteobacteria bacterium]
MAAEAGNIPRERVIEVRDVVKTYRLGDIEVHALRGVSLDIERGELVAIMGASGSGKSTLMNILGCLDQPTSGQYVLDGIDTAELDEPALAQIRSLRIGFVFQSFNLLARTSAAENVALPLFYSGRIGDSAERVHQALVSLGLGDREQSHPSQLSGGQQQRVAIARALINGPAILLADEPTGNLDSQTAVEIMTTLRDLNRREGLTVILVTHEPDMAAFCDRIVTMRDGLIVSDERRAAAFVADEHRAAAVHGPSPRLPARGGALTAAPAGGEPEADNAAPQGLRGDLSFVRMALLAAGRALARNKLRSALTMLGIFIGVAALITMVAVGQGANEAVKEQIESLGTNLVMIVPGSRTSRGVRSGFGGASTLTVADAQAIQQGDPAVARVGYEIGGNAQVQAGNQNWSTSVQGVSPSYTDIRNWPIVAGRALTAEDESTANRVCLLGQTVVKNLFGPYQNPVGATIFVKNVAVEVVGVLASRG